MREGELSPRTEGIHPWEAERWDGVAPTLSSECEAVGEIGLDYACAVNREKQEELFRRQLQLAETAHLPVVLHCVRAFEPTMRLLAQYRLHAVIFHGFIGSWQQAEAALGKGYYLSFGERSLASPRTREVIQKMPLERLFPETDESPMEIREIYHIIANLRNIEQTDLEQITMDNFKRIFKR